MQKSGIRIQIANNIGGLRGTPQYLTVLHSILTQLRLAGFKQTGLSYTKLGGVMQTMATSVEDDINEMTDAQVEGCERRIMAEVDKAESRGDTFDRRELGIEVNVTIYHTDNIKAFLLYHNVAAKLATILRQLNFAITGGDVSRKVTDPEFFRGFTTLTFKLNYEHPAANNISKLIETVNELMLGVKTAMPLARKPERVEGMDGGYAHQKVEFNPAKEVAFELKPGTGKAHNKGIRQMEFVGANFATILGHNTFRIGDKWADLEPGDILEAIIIDKAGRNPAGLLTVKWVFRGPLSNALQFSRMNHGVVDLGAQNNSSLGANELMGILRKVYPDVDGSSEAVVIQFENCEPRFQPRSFA